MLTEAVRVAQPFDGDDIRRLFQAATVELEGERGGTAWSREEFRRVRIAEFAGVDGEAVEGELTLVSTLNEVVVGYLHVFVQHVDGGDRVARVTDIFVEPGGRELSLGEMLLERAISWAIDNGCRGIDSMALPGMRQSKNFFETAGLIARKIVVYKDLP